MNEPKDVPFVSIQPEISDTNPLVKIDKQEEMHSQRLDSKSAVETKAEFPKNLDSFKSGKEVHETVKDAAYPLANKHTKNKVASSATENFSPMNEPKEVPFICIYRDVPENNSVKKTLKQDEWSFEQPDSTTAAETKTEFPINFDCFNSGMEVYTSMKNAKNYLAKKRSVKEISDSALENFSKIDESIDASLICFEPEIIAYNPVQANDTQDELTSEPSYSNFIDVKNINEVLYAKAVRNERNSLFLYGGSKTGAVRKAESSLNFKDHKSIHEEQKSAKNESKLLDTQRILSTISIPPLWDAKKAQEIKAKAKAKKIAKRQRARAAEAKKIAKRKRAKAKKRAAKEAKKKGLK